MVVTKAVPTGFDANDVPFMKPTVLVQGSAMRPPQTVQSLKSTSIHLEIHTSEYLGGIEGQVDFKYNIWWPSSASHLTGFARTVRAGSQVFVTGEFRNEGRNMYLRVHTAQFVSGR